MSIFTFRKKMSVKKIHFFGSSNILRAPYHTCFDVLTRWLERVHKKNAKKRGKPAVFGSLFGEMERHGMRATCEHNYGAVFFLF